MITDNVIELLRKHYRENVLDLPSGPNQKFIELMEQFENPDGLKKIVAEGLNKHEYIVKEVEKCDLEGLKMLGFNSDFSLIAMTISKQGADILSEKLGIGTFLGASFAADGFEEGSPFYGINLILFESSCVDHVYWHETSHMVYDIRSRSRKDIELLITKEEKKYPKGDFIPVENGECLKKMQEYLKLLLIEEETSILKEIWAESGLVDSSMIEDYARRYANRVINKIYDVGFIFPDSGVISGHKIKKITENYITRYFRRQFGAGIEAFKILFCNMPQEMVARIVICCGPTEEKIKSEKYLSPVDELILWSKYWRDALKDIETSDSAGGEEE